MTSEAESERGHERATLFAQGSQIRADGANRLKSARGAEAPRDFLFELGHTDVAFGLVIGEGYAMVGHETPHLRGITFEAAQQIVGFALFDSAAHILTRWVAGLLRVELAACSDQGPAASLIVVCARAAQARMAAGDALIDLAIGLAQ